MLTSPVWYYNWASNSTYYEMNCPSNKLRSNLEYVPMIWGWYNQTLTKDSIPSNSKALLGFNEPNFKSQSNLQPSVAVQGWKRIQSIFGDLTLISPSASPCSGNQCIPNYGSQTAWFDEFFKLCNNQCKVDYLAVHYYYCHANDLIGSLQSLYNRYNLKIWLTEFDCPGGNKTAQTEFIKQVIPLIEEKEWIVRYSWFMDRDNGYESLLTTDISKPTLTSVGDAYNTF